jgi:hypothetical protein
MEFKGFPKIARLSREVVVTEKIDGTNACICITPEGGFLTGSRTRWINPQDDNHGFAKWANGHREELMTLGEGTHFGEWWGCGIQRNYGLKEKRFSVFNVGRWCLHGQEPKKITTPDPRIFKTQDILPPCVGLVPVLYEGIFDTDIIEKILDKLRQHGSIVMPGYKFPEGIVIYHKAGNVMFKKTIEKDEEPKSKNK